MRRTMKAVLHHFRARSGCGFMSVEPRSGLVLQCVRGKGCRSPVTYAAGAPTRCQNCRRRVWLQPLAVRQVLALRCLDCLKVYCFPCARRHFKKPFRLAKAP